MAKRRREENERKAKDERWRFQRKAGENCVDGIFSGPSITSSSSFSPWKVSYGFKKGATDVLGVKIDRNILEPYFSATRARLVSEGHEREKIDFRAFQEGVVDYDAFERICSEWLEREEEKERTRSGVIASTS